MATRKPTKKTVRSSIRASVPDGKLKGARILLADIEQNKTPIGGFTEYSRERGGSVVKIGAPIGDNAYGLTVRGHETRHASKHGIHRKKPMTANEAIASQIVDDVNIEYLPIPNVKGALAYRRAHMATAKRDLRDMLRIARKVKAGEIPDSIERRNADLLSSVRTLAMTQHYGRDSGDTLKASRVSAAKAIRETIGEKSRNAIWEVIKQARRRTKRATAIAMLTALLETKDVDVDEEEREKQPIDGDVEIAEVPEGSVLDGKMTIIDLRPKTVFTSKEKSITRKYAPNGVIINATRYVSAIVSGDANGLFSRRVRQKPGGTVLIDASGSMNATKKNLSQLCELIPTATVAFYSGGDSTGKGDLVIYALNGKRYAGELPDKHLHGGNAVDLPAVKWLLAQQQPHTLVSDLGFCGGVLGSEAIAHALVERGKHRGDLTVHGSLDAAYEAFGGKGELKNE